MLRYFSIWLLLCQLTWVWSVALPVPVAVPEHNEVAPHVVIVTPQAQVHLDAVAKYGSTARFIHHLSPLAHISAPHEETIVYVPASASAAILPLEAVAQQVGRASGALPLAPIALQTKQQGGDQIATIQQAFQQAQAAASSAQAAAQDGFGQIGEQFSEAASSFSPASFFPPPSSSHKIEKPAEKLETPANTQILLPASARAFHAIASPAIPHIVDLVHGAPVLVSLVSVVRARSLEDASNVPILAIPMAEGSKVEALPLQAPELKKDSKIEALIPAAEPEKAGEIGRFLEANAAKNEDIKTEKKKLDDQQIRDDLKLKPFEQPASAGAATDDRQAIDPNDQPLQPEKKISNADVIA